MKYLVLLIALAGCAAQPPIFKPVEVDMPVAQEINLPEIKPPAFASIDAKASLTDKVKLLLADLDRHIGYEEELKAQLSLCR